MSAKSGYELTRAWFDYAFEHQGDLTPTHTAMYLWLVELNNRMGWAKQFYSPASQTMNAIGLKSYNTYKKVFNDLVETGFVKLVKESKNQWTACVIALSNFDKAHDKALDKALMKHTTKQSESTIQSTGESNYSINKQQTIKPKTIKQETENKFSPPTLENLQSFFIEKISESKWTEPQCQSESKIFFDYYSSNGWLVGKNKMKNWKAAASGWINRSKKYDNGKSNSNNSKKSIEKNRSELQILSDRSEEFLQLFGTQGI
jgi:hypothetical protein